MITDIDKKMLETLTDLHSIPSGALNIRKDGKSEQRRSSANIEIEPKTDKPGINIKIKEDTTNESVHIPVILTESGYTESVYNDFYIGKNSDVTIVAGCGIHNTGTQKSEHDGIHRFYLESNAKIRYIEKHFGFGGNADKILSPKTEIYMKDNCEFNMETTQIEGVSFAERETIVEVGDNSKFNCIEKIMTTDKQFAQTKFIADLIGKNSSCNIVSRAVAKDNSKQSFISKMIGNNNCFGHTECDCIVMDNAKVTAIPEVDAKNSDASLIHEAAIGKIAGEQITKLMTLGLDEKQAEEEIIKGFLK